MILRRVFSCQFIVIRREEALIGASETLVLRRTLAIHNLTSPLLGFDQIQETVATTEEVVFF